jgi:hypothetical protein
LALQSQARTFWDLATRPVSVRSVARRKGGELTPPNVCGRGLDTEALGSGEAGSGEGEGEGRQSDHGSGRKSVGRRVREVAERKKNGPFAFSHPPNRRSGCSHLCFCLCPPSMACALLSLQVLQSVMSSRSVLLRRSLPRLCPEHPARRTRREAHPG